MSPLGLDGVYAPPRLKETIGGVVHGLRVLGIWLWGVVVDIVSKSIR